MAEQLCFDLPFRQVRGRDAFFVSPSNQMAVAMLDAPSTWPQGKLLIIGPKGSGKSHLLDIWQSDWQAQLWSPAWTDLPPDGAKVAVDDIDTYANDEGAQTDLFHLHNHLMATGGQLLVTSTLPIVQAGFTLPDLASRLSATTATRIDPPDETLLQAVILKQFMDRQISPPLQVQQYLARNIDRSFDAVAAAVAELDTRSMAQGGKITRSLAVQVLADLAA